VSLVKHATGAKLGVYQLLMLALGSAVGGSFFLSTAIALRAAGPSILIAFAIGGGLVYIILMALSEMTTAHPSRGSFREYAEEAFGPMASFVVGWLYWAGFVLALSSEATAVALFARLWLPGVPIWLLSLSVIVGVTLLNLLDVRKFSVIESGMSAIKLLAIVAFIIVMGALIIGVMPGRPPVGLGALRGERLLPGGLGGLAGSMLIVLFGYAGFEVLGLAAPDAKEPKRTVPRAIMLTVISLIVLYVGAMLLLLPVLPLTAVAPDVSPFVAALRHGGLTWLASGFNLIVMIASISTMLAAMFGLSRMLNSLAEEGQAPAFLRRLTGAGLPRNALLTSGGAMLVGVLLAYVLPKQVYLFLVAAGGFSLIFAYLMILASQLVLRRKRGCPSTGCQLPGYPYLTWIGIVLLIGALAAMPLVPGQGAGLIVGVALLLLFVGAYWLTQRGKNPGPEPEPLPEGDRTLLR
jgi:L-asparagine transporter-like permease